MNPIVELHDPSGFDTGVAPRISRGAAALGEPPLPPGVTTLAQHGPGGIYGAPPENRLDWAGNIVAPEPPSEAVTGNVPDREALPAVSTASPPQNYGVSESRLAPPQYVGASFDRSRIPITPGTQREIEQAFGRREAIEDSAGKAEVAKNDAITAIMQRKAEWEQQQMKTMQANDAARQQYVRQRLDYLDQTQQWAAKAGTQEANQIFKAPGTMGQIASLIGRALGGGVEATTGNNPYLSAMNAELNKNLSKLREHQQLRNQGVHDQENILSAYQHVFGEQKLADMAYLNTGREYIISQIQAEAARRNDPLIMQNAERAIEAIRSQQLETRKQFDALSYVPAHVVGGMQHAAGNVGLIFEGPDGKRYTAPDAPTRTKLADMSTAVMNFRRLAQKLDAIRSKPEAYGSVTKAAADAEGIGMEMQTAIREMGHMGIYKESEIPVFEKMLGSPTGIFSRAGFRGLQAADRMAQSFNDNLRANAVQEVQPGYGVTNQGALTPKAAYTGESPSRAGAITSENAGAAGFKPVGAQ